ncbi:MAG: multicomponent Na+:H+ antiporter subunit [Solirubrobacteraceae bacterium]
MSTALVVAGVVVLAFACAGVVVMPRALARLHYVSVGSLGVVLVAAAVVVDDGASLISVKAVTLGAFMVATSPVLAHAGGRAIHDRAERRR